jgi:hypothetical protein
MGVKVERIDNVAPKTHNSVDMIFEVKSLRVLSFGVFCPIHVRRDDNEHLNFLLL